MGLSNKQRYDILLRDGFTCQYCGRKPPEVSLEVDHIEPKSKGGKDDEGNLITSCWECNSGKGAMDVIGANEKEYEKFAEPRFLVKMFLALIENVTDKPLSVDDYVRLIESIASDAKYSILKDNQSVTDE